MIPSKFGVYGSWVSPYEDKICKTKRRFVEIYRARHAIRQISSLTENSGETERMGKGVTTNNLPLFLYYRSRPRAESNNISFHLFSPWAAPPLLNPTPFDVKRPTPLRSELPSNLFLWTHSALLIPLSITLATSVISADRQCESGNTFPVPYNLLNFSRYYIGIFVSICAVTFCYIVS